MTFEGSRLYVLLDDNAGDGGVSEKTTLLVCRENNNVFYLVKQFTRSGRITALTSNSYTYGRMMYGGGIPYGGVAN